MLLSAKRCRDPDAWNGIVARTTAAHAITDPMTSRTWSLEQHDGVRFVVCELVAGTSVADEMERLGPLPPLQAGSLGLQITNAIGELHAAGHAHGQLSLDVLRREPPPQGGGERDGRVRLLQFPLAGDPHAASPVPAAGDEEALIQLGRRAAYVAPELLRGGRPDPRSDVYAIGGMLHALLSGQPPHWDGGVLTAVKAASALGPPPLPGAVPQRLRDVVATMMDRDPAHRYADAREAAKALGVALGLAEPAISGTAPSAQEPPRAAGGSTSVARRRSGKRLGLIGGLHEQA